MRSDHAGVLKTRLRSSVSQERLEAFMLMSVEREQLEKVQFQNIVNEIQSSWFGWTETAASGLIHKNDMWVLLFKIQYFGIIHNKPYAIVGPQKASYR